MIPQIIPQFSRNSLQSLLTLGMTKRAKTLKTKGFQIESKNKFGKVVFRVSIIKYEKYKKFRLQATPKGEGKRIDKEFNTEEKLLCICHMNGRRDKP